MNPAAAPPALKVVLTGDGRNAPASVEAERAAIGAVILREELLPDLEDLVVDDFYLPAHREIWLTIRALHEKGRKLDLIAIEDDLKQRGALPKIDGSAGYLMDCANAVPHTENVGHYARIIRDKSGLRKVLRLCIEVSSRVHGGGQLDDVLASARSGVADLEACGSGPGPVRVGEELQRAMDTIEDRYKNPSSHSVPTGNVRFDSKIGGLRPERLIVVAARPGMGKSAWAGGVAVHCAMRGIPALLVSLEMARQELIERFLAGEARVSTKDIGTGDVIRDEDKWRSVFGAARSLSDVPLFIDDRDSMTTGQALGTIRRWYAKHVGVVPPKDQPPKPAFVGVDYLQLLASDENEESENRNLEVAKMTRAFKRLSKSLRIPVVLISQLNRTTDKQGRKPVLSDLRDSGAIEQDADQVIFPWRDMPKDEEGRDLMNASGPAEWIVGKNRGGPKGSIPVYWAAEFTRFENLTDDRDLPPNYVDGRDAT